MTTLVSTDWLAAHRNEAHILDASYYLAEHARDAAAEHAAAHIPGAMFLDLAMLADAASPLPMTLPAPRAIADRLAALGIATGDAIVLYDDSPLRSSARAWWMLRTAGIAASILDGGLAKWRAEGRPVTADTPAVAPAAHEPGPPLASVRDLAAMRDVVTTGAAQIVDARSPARFAGSEPEARAGVEPGHIPGSRNLHYAKLFAADGTYKPAPDLAAAFADAGVDPARPAVATCGSGVTAAILVVAAHLIGHDVALYDGSWTEWGSHPETPKARA